MTDKDYCCSSFLAFRYVEETGKEFYDGLKHRTYTLPEEKELVPIGSSVELDNRLEELFGVLEGKKLGILLSGGMDSACLAVVNSNCPAKISIPGNF